MATELELKYRSGHAQMAVIRRDYPDLHPITMETAYFDAPGRPLGQKHWTLRRRLENSRSVCALKTPGENGVTGEWEVEETSLEAAIPKLCQLGAPRELLALTGLTQVCAARFTRLAGLLDLGSATVELALDQGVLLGGGREEALCEVEIELKSGDREALMAFGRDFARKYGLETEHKSKFARANALASEV